MASISPAVLERALQAWLAKKLPLEIDKTLFRGPLPAGADNSASVMASAFPRRNADVQMDAWNVQLLAKFQARDDAMAFVAEASRLAPAGPVSATIDGVSFSIDSIIPRGDAGAWQEDSDGGAVKWMASLNWIASVR